MSNQLEFDGPRPACRALDGLMDELGDPIIEIIEGLNLTEEEKNVAKAKIEDVIVRVFGHQDQTVMRLRTYIYELNRELKKEN